MLIRWSIVVGTSCQPSEDPKVYAALNGCERWKVRLCTSLLCYVGARCTSKNLHLLFIEVVSFLSCKFLECSLGCLVLPELQLPMLYIIAKTVLSYLTDLFMIIQLSPRLAQGPLQ